MDRKRLLELLADALSACDHGVRDPGPLSKEEALNKLRELYKLAAARGYACTPRGFMMAFEKELLGTVGQHPLPPC